MSMTNTELCALMVQLESVFTGDRYGGAPINSIQAIATRQTASFSSFTAGVLNGCQTASVIWLDECSNTVVDCDGLSSCEITGGEATSQATNLAHNLCKTIDFAIDLSSCNNAYTPDMLRASMIAKNIARIETALNQAAGAFLLANAETVAAASFPGGTVGTAPGGTIGDPQAYVNYADAAEWVPSIIGELLQGANAEGIFDPYFISGGLLYSDWYNAQINNPNCCQDGDILVQGPSEIVFDTKDLDATVNNGAKNMFIVDPDATAFWSANNFSNDTPQPLNDKFNTWVWRVRSPRLQFSNGGVLTPVYYDVMRQVNCNVGSGVKIGPNGHGLQEQYRIIFNGGLHVAPDTTCAGDYPGTSTGIIHVGQGADPV